MNADYQDFKYKELTEKIIKIFYRVYNNLGYGFLEKIYENAMMIEFKKEGIFAVAQFGIKVFYEGEVIGEYYADILVDNRVIVEIKAAKRLVEENEAQLLNYLKARPPWRDSFGKFSGSQKPGLGQGEDLCPK